MDIRMASLPGCGLGGGGGGGGSSSSSQGNSMVKGFPVPKGNQQTVGPQVTLICGQPPVLDTTGCKSSGSQPTSGFCRNTRKVGGNLLASIRNMYNSICSSPSLTWVNPEIIPEFHPAAAPPSITPYSVTGAFYVDQTQPLWYPAAAGSQFEYEDPLHILSYQLSDTLPPYSSNLPPGSTYNFSKSSQPLNPEAKEWIPSGYKDNVNKSSVSDCSEIELGKSKLPKLSTGDFTEISETEIDAVRRNSTNKVPKKTQDCLVSESSNKVVHLKEGEVTDFCIIPQKSSLESESKISEVSKDEGLQQHENCKVPAEVKCFMVKQQEDGSSLSYATITQKSVEPLITPNVKTTFDGKSIGPVECVKQPLPKIFTKDKIYPKEKAPLVMENKKRDVLPFKTASKLQKRCSKKFLRDLKESSPVKSDISFSGSEGSLESATDIIEFCMSSSPVILGLHGNEFSREKTESVRSQRSPSESSASSHVRTVSESTVGSVESIDIEFGDFDIYENKQEENHVPADDCKSKSSVEGKYANSILAHILCYEESDSEDSDNDSDDSDWDTVQECIIQDVDDSWETFGLSIPLITKSLSCSELGKNDKLNIFEDVCDNVGISSLTEINKKWNEEVCKGVTGSSPCKVSFGEVKVHPMVSWSFAYKNARRGPWEQYARDRSRFNNRVLSLEPIITPVLSDNHRKSMYCKLYGL